MPCLPYLFRGRPFRRIFRLRSGECQVRLPDGKLMIIPVSKKYGEQLLAKLYEKGDFTEIP